MAKYQVFLAGASSPVEVQASGAVVENDHLRLYQGTVGLVAAFAPGRWTYAHREEGSPDVRLGA